VDKSVDPSG
jgi:hypothetical protein